MNGIDSLLKKMYRMFDSIAICFLVNGLEDPWELTKSALSVFC